MVFSQKLISTLIFILKLIYLLPPFLLIASLVLLILLRFPLSLLSEQIQLSDFLGVLIVLSFSYGLHRRKSWVVPLIVYLNGLCILGLFLTQPNNLLETVAKFLGLIFLAFGIFFFTRKEVKKYFNVKSLMLFSR